MLKKLMQRLLTLEVVLDAVVQVLVEQEVITREQVQAKILEQEDK